MDVLKLIAKGNTNSKIAEQLVINVGPVKGHVSNTLNKLQLADRTRAVCTIDQRFGEIPLWKASI